MQTTASFPSPDNAAHWGFWGTLLFGLLVYLVFTVVESIAVAGAIKVGRPDVSMEELMQLFVAAGDNGRLLAIATLVSLVPCCMLIVLIIAIKRGSDLRDYLSLRAVAPATLAKWIAALVACLVAWDVMTALLGRAIVPEFVRAAWDTGHPLWLTSIALVLAAPLFEETFFRGFLLRGFEGTFLRPAGAIVATSLLWALIHVQYDLYNMTFIFLIGLILGTARIVTRSLYVPLALHMTTNFASILEVALLG